MRPLGPLVGGFCELRTPGRARHGQRWMGFEFAGVFRHAGQQFAALVQACGRGRAHVMDCDESHPWV